MVRSIDSTEVVGIITKFSFISILKIINDYLYKRLYGT